MSLPLTDCLRIRLVAMRTTSAASALLHNDVIQPPGLALAAQRTVSPVVWTKAIGLLRVPAGHSLSGDIFHQLLLATLHVGSRVEMLCGERHYALVLQMIYTAAKFAEITTPTYLTSGYNQLLSY
jgi:hypothetical protein